jgi:PAB-dependent poly(A)-specific ribonuclease subunit 2
MSVLILLVAHNLIELMDYGIESQDHNYAHMIQSFHRFLMDTLAIEGNSAPNNPWIIPQRTYSELDYTLNEMAPSPITQLCGVDAKNIITCGSCGAVREKDNMVHIIDLVYPKKVHWFRPTLYLQSC